MGGLIMQLDKSFFLVVIVSVCTLLVHGQDNAQTRIPDNLIACYRDQSLRHPENRPPMSIETFIDIVRKVEKYQRGTVDINTLATSMLHSFRLDGIERSQDVLEMEGVIPYAVKGIPFYKHRLVLRYLVPSNEYQFPNESLTQVELCTLHFMLSHSIDKTQRGDESTVCGRLSNYESGRGSRKPRNARFRRQEEEVEATTNKQSLGPQDENQNSFNSEGAHDTVAEESTEKVADTIVQSLAEEASEDTLKQTNEDDPHQAEEPPETSQEDENAKKKEDEVEMIKQTTTVNELKNGKFIFDDDKESNNYPQQKAKNIMEPTTIKNLLPRVTVSTVESDCPVENGVVRTDWGTVSLGTVLSGIVAGLYPQQIRIADLVQKAMQSRTLTPELSSAVVDNKFAATLVGDLSEVALEQGPKRLQDIKVGVSGGWNSTIFPRWYFDKEKEGHELTDAEIRGGLDGLVMGTYIQKWKQFAPSLKLSQLLSMYYSENGVFETQYRACQRRDLYSEVAPNTVMEEQTYRFTIVLDQQSISSASVDNARVKTFAETAVRSLGSYLPAMIENSCTRAGTTREISPASLTPYTNVTVVIDKNWAYSDIKKILSYLVKKLELGEYGSRVTVLDGKNRIPFITDVMYTTDFDAEFNESAYNTHEGGMDIPRALEQELQKNMEDLLIAEEKSKTAGGRSTVIVFIPRESVNLNNNDLTIAKERVKHFREYLPDVKFLYLSPGNKDNYKELVDNPSTDIFTFIYQGTEIEIPGIVDPLVDRIKRVPLRLQNPTCGADWSREDYGTAEYIHSVKSKGVKYHRLHPNYFYGVESAKVTVINSNSDEIDVCYSRKLEYPDNATTDVTCKKIRGENVEIQLVNPCDGFEFISQCPPLFISVKSTDTVLQPSCNYDCVYPNNVQYAIRNEGLGCTAGIGRSLSDSQLISFVFTLVLLLKSLSAVS